MNKTQFIKLGASEELAEKLAEASKEEMKGYVERAKYNLLATEKDTLDVQLKSYSKQLEDLKQVAKGSEVLETKIKELQDGNEKTRKQYEKKISDIHLNHAIDEALKTAKARNRKAVVSLLDMDNIAVGEDGKVKGLDKQIKALQEAEDSRFLFDLEPNPADGKPSISDNGQEGNQGNASGQASKSIGEIMAQAYNAVMSPQGDGKQGE